MVLIRYLLADPELTSVRSPSAPISVDRIYTVVVFPTQFGPSSAKILPA
jgi:hypothetical protein